MVYKKIYLMNLTVICLLFFNLLSHGQESGNILTLKQAITKTLEQNPQIKAYRIAVDAKNALIQQAKLIPNPEIEIETENLGGGASSIILGQLIELGGKRSSRIKISEKDKEIAKWDYEILRMEIIAETNTRFLEVLAIQLQMEFIDKSAALAESILVAVKSRVQAGAAMAVEETRAQVERTLIGIKRAKIEYDFAAGKSVLAAMWGGNGSEFKIVQGEIDIMPSIPEIAAILSQSSKSPELARWAVELDKRRLEQKSAKAEKAPNISIGGGYLRNNETSENAAILNLSLDLPVFNRNQGGILESKLNLDIVNQEKKNTEIRINAALNQLYAQLKGCHYEVQALENEGITGAAGAFNKIHKLYAAGRVGYMDLIDAQRNLIELQINKIEASIELLKIKAEIEKITGIPFEDLR
ncbi:MAG: TolC family protein [bacterium]